MLMDGTRAEAFRVLKQFGWSPHSSDLPWTEKLQVAAAPLSWVQQEHPPATSLDGGLDNLGSAQSAEP